MTEENGDNNGESKEKVIKIYSSRPKLEPIQYKQLHKKPFKLRFGKQHDLGKSTVSPTKPASLPPIVSSKFYSRETHEFIHKHKNSIDKINEHINRLFETNPQQSLTLPKLESHKYGWYHDVCLSDRNINDQRFNFGIRNSTMVKYRLLVLASDRDMNIRKY